MLRICHKKGIMNPTKTENETTLAIKLDFLAPNTQTQGNSTKGARRKECNVQWMTSQQENANVSKKKEVPNNNNVLQPFCLFMGRSQKTRQ